MFVRLYSNLRNIFVNTLQYSINFSKIFADVIFICILIYTFVFPALHPVFFLVAIIYFFYKGTFVPKAKLWLCTLCRYLGANTVVCQECGTKLVPVL